MSKYKYRGLELPSVTTIISDCTNSSGALTQWSANMVVQWIRENCKQPSDNRFHVTHDDLNKARFEFRNVSQKALDIGSEVHNAIEKHLQGLGYSLTTKEAENGFQAFLKWEKEVDLKPIALEQTIYGNGFAGTLDFVGFYKGKLYVIDWKTSKAFYPEMRYQVAIYRWATAQRIIDDWRGYDIELHREIYENDIPVGCGILRLDKETGMPEFKDTSKSYKQDLIVFNKMLELYMERHPRIKSKAFEKED